MHREAQWCTIVHMTSRQYLRGFRNLRAWKESHALAVDLYKRTTDFPKEDRYGLTDQIRRAACSVSSLIAEGACMRTPAHQCSYYLRAHGSLSEVDNHIEFAHALGRVTDVEYQQFLSRINYIAGLVLGLVKSTQSSLPQNLRTSKLQN